MGKWKGVKVGVESAIELYDLSEDIGEKNDLSMENPEIVTRIKEIMKEAYVPSEDYPIGGF